jgi:hypothetical protein
LEKIGRFEQRTANSEGPPAKPIFGVFFEIMVIIEKQMPLSLFDSASL